MNWVQALVITVVGALLAWLGWLYAPAPVNTALLIIGVLVAVVGGIMLLLALVRMSGTPPRV